MDIDELMRSLSKPRNMAEESADIRVLDGEIDEMIRNLSKPPPTCKPCSSSVQRQSRPADHGGLRGSLDKLLESLRNSRPR